MALSRVYDNWERLVRGTLLREQLRSASEGPGCAGTGLAGDVSASIGNATKIDAILQAADDIVAEDPNVARILCEQAYLMAQKLDPNSGGGGVLQTGLMTVIMHKLAKKDGAAIDRQHDIERLWKFYLTYKRQHQVDIIQRKQWRLRELESLSTNLGVMETRALEMIKVYATLRALIDVLEILVGDSYSDGLGRLVMVEIKKIKKSGATLGGELIPIDVPSLTNVIGFFPEVGTKVMVSRWMSRMKQPKRG